MAMSSQAGGQMTTRTDFDGHGQSAGASGDPVLPRPAATLTLSQAEAIVSVIEAAPYVSLRSQFFVWTQSQMQTLLPHRVLVCGSYDRSRRRLLFNVFNSIWLPAPAMKALSDDDGPFLTAVVAAWVGGNARPLAIDLAHFNGDARPLADMLGAESGIERIVVHGIARPRRPHEVESLFIFADTGSASTLPHEVGAELMLPSLHAAWRRVVSTDPAPRAGMSMMPPAVGIELPQQTGSAVTNRERQILDWVRDGKSNREIAEILGLSPLTVKNHVQKILRKLGASNRTQAVAQAMARGLLEQAQQLGAQRAASR
jgi:transcriptional regulator EpsA